MGLTPYTTTEIRVHLVGLLAETAMDAVRMDSAVKLDTPAKENSDGLSKATLTGGLVAAILASVCCLGDPADGHGCAHGTTNP